MEIGYEFYCERCIFVTECPRCHGVNVTILDDILGSIKFIDGYLIQDCFPSLDLDTRETLKSGYCPECFKELFRANKKQRHNKT